MLPSQLVWETEPLPEPIEFVGSPELTLDAAISAIDTTWIVTLQDVMPDDTTQDVTASWLCAMLHEDAILPVSETVMWLKLAALWVGELVDTLGAIAEDVDFLSPVPKTNWRGYHCSSIVKAARRLSRLSNDITYLVIYAKSSLQSQANYISL